MSIFVNDRGTGVHCIAYVQDDLSGRSRVVRGLANYRGGKHDEADIVVVYNGGTGSTVTTYRGVAHIDKPFTCHFWCKLSEIDKAIAKFAQDRPDFHHPELEALAAIKAEAYGNRETFHPPKVEFRWACRPCRHSCRCCPQEGDV